ncbi:MAG: hypothetical protein QXU98_08000 [Candidatus Parvarchaeota archaeon]
MNKIDLDLEIYRQYHRYISKREYDKKWKKNNPERVKEHNRKYYNSHRLYWKIYRLNKRKYFLGSKSTYLIYHSDLTKDLTKDYLHNLAEKIRNKSI